MPHVIHRSIGPPDILSSAARFRRDDKARERLRTVISGWRCPAGGRHFRRMLSPSLVDAFMTLTRAQGCPSRSSAFVFGGSRVISSGSAADAAEKSRWKLGRKGPGHAKFAWRMTRAIATPADRDSVTTDQMGGRHTDAPAPAARRPGDTRRHARGSRSENAADRAKAKWSAWRERGVCSRSRGFGPREACGDEASAEAAALTERGANRARSATARSRPGRHVSVAGSADQ
jgi:hypothetical protein